MDNISVTNGGKTGTTREREGEGGGARRNPQDFRAQLPSPSRSRVMPHLPGLALLPPQAITRIPENLGFEKYLEIHYYGTPSGREGKFGLY